MIQCSIKAFPPTHKDMVVLMKIFVGLAFIQQMCGFSSVAYGLSHFAEDTGSSLRQMNIYFHLTH